MFKNLVSLDAAEKRTVLAITRVRLSAIGDGQVRKESRTVVSPATPDHIFEIAGPGLAPYLLYSQALQGGVRDDPLFDEELAAAGASRLQPPLVKT